MQITAKLVQVLPLESGTGRNGEWKKQNVIVETDGQYPKKICISIWGDRINPDQLKEGNDLTIDFDVESREFNGRWYTDVKAWRVEVAGAQSTPSSAPAAASSDISRPELPPEKPQEYDDLPF